MCGQLDDASYFTAVRLNDALLDQVGTSLMSTTAVVNPGCSITIDGSVPSGGSMTVTAGNKAHWLLNVHR